jgi:diketogulonate reductase-like aldo/keto reductase
MSLNSYATLGRSGLRISPFTLGTMTFGEDHGWGSSPEESKSILAAYLDQGGNSIDTANIYTNGHAEAIVGDYFDGQSALRAPSSPLSRPYKRDKTTASLRKGRRRPLQINCVLVQFRLGELGVWP